MSEEHFRTTKDPDKPVMPSWWHPEAMMAVYSGEGSPDEISAVLTLVDHYGAKKVNGVDKDLPQPISADMETYFQTYTKKIHWAGLSHPS